VIGERVDHMAANQQVLRAQELRDLIQLSQEEHFNVFELVPSTPLDAYFDRIQKGIIKSAMVGCTDDNVDQEIQTETVDRSDKFN